MDKKGQIAIFVILAIVLVVSIGLFFAINRGVPILERSEEFNPETFIDKCIKNGVRNIVEVVLSRGGIAHPTDYKIYNNTNVAYICKNINYYYPCVTQYPRYLQKLETELGVALKEKMEGCFLSFEENLESRGYQYSGSDITTEIKLKPEIIEAKVYRDFQFSKGDLIRKFDLFHSLVRSPAYELGLIANEIASQEARFCHFSHEGFMLLYPRFDIRKFTFTDSSEIYIIKDRKTGIGMNIAIRGCAIPAGF
tara:strand:+ start:37 stop:792 length:756 start_codon:yes stop_codon:yes gene_type:complete